MLKVGETVFIARSRIFIFRKRKQELKNFFRNFREGRKGERGRERIMCLWAWGKKRGEHTTLNKC